MEILRDAERRLRDLVGQAATSGEYDSVVQITEVAKAVGALAELPVCTSGSPSVKAGLRGADAIPQPARCQSGRLTDYTSKPNTRRKKGKGVYPRFYRQNDSLVKVAWSKRERNEYEHKAPWRVVEGLAAALTRKGANGKLFTSEDILPLSDPSDGSEVPSYQAYLALAWMRAEQLVVQHGRRGYTVPSASKLPDTVSARFAALATAPLT